MHYPIISGLLLGTAVALALLCCIGLLVMRDTFQRLHFSAPVVAISMTCVAIAVYIEDGNPQSRIKVTIIAIALPLFNAVLTHATARAARIRKTGHWPLHADETIPIIGGGKAAGMVQEPLE